MKIQHSSKNDDWATPKHIMDRVHNVLGNIELDPASSIIANSIVKADKFYTKKDDPLNIGFWCNEPVTIYLNPPGGKRSNKSLSGLFWAKLMDHLLEGLVDHAIFMGFSLEQLAVTQGYHQLTMCDFPVCIPRKRIAFIDPLGEKRSQPSHSNVIVYVPGITNKTSKFKEEFGDLGKFMTMG